MRGNAFNKSNPVNIVNGINSSYTVPEGRFTILKFTLENSFSTIYNTFDKSALITTYAADKVIANEFILKSGDIVSYNNFSYTQYDSLNAVYINTGYGIELTVNSNVVSRLYNSYNFSSNSTSDKFYMPYITPTINEVTRTFTWTALEYNYI